MEPSRFWQRLIPLFSHPTGLAIDRLLMRVLDLSLMGHMYERAGGFPLRRHLLLRTIHWGTGALRTVVLPYQTTTAPDGRERLLVIGSHGGRPTDPVWVHNIRARGDVWYRVGRRWHFGRARVAEPGSAEREAWWKEITRAGAYVYYARTAHPRIIPVVALEPAAAGSKPPSDSADC